MTFRSILSETIESSEKNGVLEPPAFFADLNLDQVVQAITARKQEYELQPFLYAPLRTPQTIIFRQAVMRDMEEDRLRAAINLFAQKMALVRRYLGLVAQLEFNYHKKGWFLEAGLEYCEAVTNLVSDLKSLDLKSRGFLDFREYLTQYALSAEFQVLQADARQVQAGLTAISYCVLIKGDTVKVRKSEGEIDYSLEVEKTFEKFKQGAVKDYRVKLNDRAGMNHIEAQVLAFVARLYPEAFVALDQFCAQHNPFLADPLRIFDREIQFYVTYCDYIADLKQAGLAFCYPQIATTDKEIHDEGGFDIALAHKRIKENAAVVANDFYLKDPERILVISGPNQGGKTTFARTFGQLHYLASLGYPVPGRSARLFLFDQIYTHFEKEEDIHNLQGKLADDLIRIHDILAQATPQSILILNEVFASTTVQDAVFLSQEIMTRASALDLLGVWVTFISELASFNEKTVSMVSTVAPENPARRTFKVVRKIADGLAYALALAEKHRLSYPQLKERLQP